MIPDSQLNIYHSRFNPFPTHPGFGLRVYRAKQAIEKLAEERYKDIHTRGFDHCFENGDGDAVVWALMHHAVHETEPHNLLTRGLQITFNRTLDGQQYPPQWMDVYKRRFSFSKASYFTRKKVAARFCMKAACLNLLKAANKVRLA